VLGVIFQFQYIVAGIDCQRIPLIEKTARAKWGKRVGVRKGAGSFVILRAEQSNDWNICRRNNL
jgi:hypothetical protein